MKISDGGAGRADRLGSLPAAVREQRAAGRVEEAIALAREWAALDPQDCAAWTALAGCLSAAQRPDLALEAWARADRLDGTSATALAGMAGALQALGRPSEAAVHFERALAASPTMYEARFGFAKLALDGGDLAAAERHAALLAGAHPGQPGVLWLTAQIAAAGDDHDRVRETAAALLATPGLGLEQQAETLLMMSHALDRLGLAAEAFAAAVRGKAIQRRVFAPRAAGHEGEVDRLTRLAAWFAAADPSPWAIAPAPVPGEAAGHAFLVGFPRSGTTLLEQALAGHPAVAALEEAPTLADTYTEYMRSAAGLERLARLSDDEARIWRAHYWETVRAHGAAPAGRMFLDKAPAGALHLPLIAKLFPAAKVLFAVRDPRDVVLSCLVNAFQLNSTTYAFTDLAETAACYDASMKLVVIYRRLLPLAVREVRYESLVGDFEGELARIAAFLGLPFDPAMSDVAATARSRVVRTPSAARLRAGLDQRGAGRWRAYATPLASVASVLEPWVERFGYAGTATADGAALR